MDFSLTGNKKTAGSSAEQKDAIKQRVGTEIAMANAQQLISKATEKCYSKCVSWPGQSLSGKEQTCVERCLERYFEAFNIVSSTYVRRVSAERAAGAMAGGA
ncbi:protein translocase subunit [Malassezia sp. CBS 17886]|nr:protein translocase subunit [Malassezia sp. CBS 17886]